MTTPLIGGSAVSTVMAIAPLSPYATRMASLFVATALLASLAIFHVVTVSSGELSRVRRATLAAVVSLLVTFGAVVLSVSLQVI